MSNKKGFFYLPTWTIILFSILCLGATLFDLYLFLNLESLKAITINGVKFEQGSEQYLKGIQTMKYGFGGGALLTAILSLILGWFGYKRIKRKNSI